MKATLAAAPLLENAYEDLRSQALSGLRQTQGLALFLSRGLTEWLYAWSQCFRPPEEIRSADMVSLPARSEVTQLLANMVLYQGGFSL